MKIIFLDIDGVLNHELWFKKVEGENLDFKDYELSMIDPEKIELLNQIISDTGAKVVISSSWRKSHTLEEILKLFKIKGFKGEIIGMTPVLYFSGVEGYDYSVPRGNEIKAWLEMNKGVLGDKMSKVKYVIFDDDSDMLLWQRENYFRVDNYCGLTRNVVYRATQFLLK